MMAETTTLCVSVQAGEHLLSGPDWLKVEDAKTLVDVLVEVSGTQALGYQVQVIVSKEPSFTEAALMQILNCVSMLRSSGSIYVKFLLKSSVLPSQQRYEETKCKAERDTDVPLIESLLSPMNKDEHTKHIPNIMSFDNPFESNYLNKLLSDQKLSPTTLSSLKKELIKKKHFKEPEHYTTWQEQSITSPVKVVEHVPIIPQQFQDQGLTDWADSRMVENSRENEESSDDKLLESEMHKTCDAKKDKDHQQDRDRKKEESGCVMGPNTGRRSVEKQTESNSTMNEVYNNPPKTNAKVKGVSDVKKATAPKTIIPKINRSTALRVRKNAVATNGTQKKDKSESHKSGMPILSQKTTRSTQFKPYKTVKSRSGSSIVQESPNKEPGCSIKSATFKKATVPKKEISQNLIDGSKRLNKKNSCLESKKKETTQSKLEKFVKEKKMGKDDKDSRCPSNENEVGVDRVVKSVKTKMEEHDIVAKKCETKYQLIGEGSIDKGKDVPIARKDEDLKDEFSIINQIKNTNKSIFHHHGNTDETMKDIYIQSKEQIADTNNQSKKPLVHVDTMQCNKTTTKFQDPTLVKECGLVLCEPEVTSTPNSLVMPVSCQKPVFSFNNIDNSRIKNNEIIDSFDEITIYESKHENSEYKPIEPNETLIKSSGTTKEKLLSDFEIKIVGNQYEDRCQHTEVDDLNISAVNPGDFIHENLLSNETKDSGSVLKHVVHTEPCIDSDQQPLSERIKYFNMPSDASSCAQLKSSFDSFDFMESSEMLRKSSFNRNIGLKRSESLDRYLSGTAPKKLGFFHDLKEKTKNAESISFYSVHEDDDIRELASIPIVDESSDKFSLPLTLSHDSINHVPANIECLVGRNRSPSKSQQSCLNITMDKDDLDNLLTDRSISGMKSNREGPALISDIGRESALSRTFSLENDNPDKVIQSKDELKEERSGQSNESRVTMKCDKNYKTSSNHRVSPNNEEARKSIKYKQLKDEGPSESKIDFGEDIECHSRKKWNLESDIIDQLLVSSLEDQCRSLNTTAQRILKRLRSAEHKTENFLRFIEEAERPTGLGITGRLFKSLQHLEKQLSEIENNLGIKIDERSDIANCTKHG